MHETVSLKPTEPKSTLLDRRLVCWLRSVFKFTLARPRKAHHIVLKRRVAASSPSSSSSSLSSLSARLGLRVVPIAATKSGTRRPRNKSSPVR